MRGEQATASLRPEDRFGPGPGRLRAGEPEGEKIQLFLDVFRGRSDTHAVRWESAGRSGYRPVSGPLTQAAVERQLRGLEVLGLYPMLPDGTTWFLTADFDGPEAERSANDAGA